MSVSFKDEQPERRSTVGLLLLVAGIVFLAMNLRSPITAVGPVLDLIRDSLNISNTTAGILTTIPLIAFGVLSPFAPRLSRRFGMEVTLFFVLIVLSLGLMLRPIGSMTTVYIGTLLIGAGIAIANVLMPPFVKMKFPKNIGMMTGVYSISMNLTGAIAAGLSVPIARSEYGWQASIGVWALLGIIALIFWIPQLKYRQKRDSATSKDQKDSSLLRSKLAWQVTIFMGLQSLLFYSIVSWFPIILQGRGMSADKAGWMLSFVQFTQLPITFIMPIIAAKMKNQIVLVWLVFITTVLGTLSVLSGQMMLVLPAAILFGIATGTAFSLAMMFFSLRTDTVFEAADLSAMAQSVGYLIAATGPVVFGLLYDLTNNWTSSLTLLIIAAGIILFTGLGAGQDTTISKSAQPTTNK